MRIIQFALVGLMGMNAAAQGRPLTIDLKGVRDLAPKGRVQDKEYNPRQRVIDQLIAAGQDSLVFLVSKLEDEIPVGHTVLDYWYNTCVGDVAFLILCDFTTTSDCKHCTVNPGLWTVVPNTNQKSAYQNWSDFVEKVGRAEIRRLVQQILKLDSRKFVWDKKEACFRPVP